MSIRPLWALLTLCCAASAQTPDAIWSGETLGDGWGSVVATLGDVDNDGVLDLGIASPDADAVVPGIGTFADAGRVEVRSGADGSLLRVWIGNLSGLSRFGYAIADAGDTNGDGHDDVLVGAPREDGVVPASGAVFLYSGATGEQLLRLDGLQTNSRFGHSLAGRRDANDDGIDDIVVGAPHHDYDDTNGGFGEEGAVWVYSGSDGAPLHVEFGTTIVVDINIIFVNEKRTWFRRHFGWAVAVGGDRDQDGKADIVATAPLTDYEYDGEGPPIFVPETGMWVLFDIDSEKLADRRGGSGDRLGWSLASLGEIGGDHGLEFAVGAPGDGFGSVQAVDTRFPGVLGYWLGTPGARIGEVVAAVGDWDGDLARDIAIGSPEADVGSPFTILDAGRVQVVSTLAGSVLAEFSGASGNRIGGAVAGAVLDVGDPPSLLIGAPELDSPATNAGAAWFYAGSPCSDASGTSYGTGWPGTLGVPALQALSPPAIGTTFELAFDNSLGVTTSAWLVFGVAPASAPFKGGTLLVTPLIFLPLPLPPGTLVLPITLGDDEGICGAHLYLQGFTVDPGASAGISLTNGLDLLFGD